MFEEWLYLGKFGYPKNSDDSSLLLVKVFCFADKVGLSNLQNATLDAIRDRAAEQHVFPPAQDIIYETYPQPRGLFGSAQRPIFGMPQDDAVTTSPGFGKPVAKPLPPATVSAIKYAYENTPERSPLRKLLTDIFAYDVKPDTLDEDILSFPNEFVADVLLANMKRLPFRLDKEEADFDKNAERYHIHNSSSTPGNRNQSTSEDAEAKGQIQVVKGRRKGTFDLGISVLGIDVVLCFRVGNWSTVIIDNNIFLLSLPTYAFTLSPLKLVKFLVGTYRPSNEPLRSSRLHI